MNPLNQGKTGKLPKNSRSAERSFRLFSCLMGLADWIENNEWELVEGDPTNQIEFEQETLLFIPGLKPEIMEVRIHPQ